MWRVTSKNLNVTIKLEYIISIAYYFYVSVLLYYTVAFFYLNMSPETNLQQF